MAQGEYCWLMSDDDLLKPGAVELVLDRIRQNYALIIVNAEIRNADLSERIEERRLPISVDRVYAWTDYQDLMAEVGPYLSYIGCVVINRQLWNEREKDKYFGTDHIHVGVIFQRPLRQPTLVIAEPLISLRYGNAIWSARSFEIWMFKWPRLIWSFSDYSDSVKRRVGPREPWRKTLTLLSLRGIGVYSPKEYSHWLKPRLTAWSERLIPSIIAHLPGCWVNFLGIIYFSFFRRRSNLSLWDLKNSRFYYVNCFRRLYRKTFGGL